MPIHRHEHAERSSVFAFDSELDEWLAQRRPIDPSSESVVQHGKGGVGTEMSAGGGGDIANVLGRYLLARHSDTDRRVLQYALMAGVLRPQLLADAQATTVEDSGPRDSTLVARFQQLCDELLQSPRGCPPPLPRAAFLGRENALQQVLSLLMPQASVSGALRQAIVTGVPGVGKTTLSAVLSRDPEIARVYPDGVLWTCLDKAPALVAAIAGWGRALGDTSLLRAATVDDAAAAVRFNLQHKRFLLMVDDVWDAGHGAVFQQMLTTGCGLLVTTRLPKVAEALSSSGKDVHVLRELDQTNASRLMSLLASEVFQRWTHECDLLVSDLERLPLAIHVAAHLLRKQHARGLDVIPLIHAIRDGSAVVDATAPSDRTADGVVPTVRALLRKSTDLLTDDTRQCFAALGAFAPKPATFDLAAMRAVCDVSDAEPLANELLDCGLLEPLGDGRFRMHALLVAHANALTAVN
jgi:hypothetical protein